MLKMSVACLFILFSCYLHCGVAAPGASSGFHRAAAPGTTIATDNMKRQEQRGLAETTTIPPFQLSADFFDHDKCDPCISRTESVIQVLVASSSVSDPQWTASKSTSTASNKICPEQWTYMQSAMEQASRDTGIRLVFSIFDEATEINSMVSEIQKLARDKAVDAMIVVGIPSRSTDKELVEQAVREALGLHSMPVFGLGAKYDSNAGFLGLVSQDDFAAGEAVGRELVHRLTHTEAKEGITDDVLEEMAISTNKKALFIASRDTVEGEDTHAGAHYRFQGVVAGFEEARANKSESMNTTATLMDAVEWTSAILQDEGAPPSVSSSSPGVIGSFTTQLAPEDSCLYDIIVVDDEETAETILIAMEEVNNRCNNSQTVGATFGVSATIHKAILRRKVGIAAAPQLYLESVFAVTMASIFVTTGKKLALPIDSKNLYLSGPSIYAYDDKDRLPENSLTKCKDLAFPVCNPESENLAAFDSPILASSLQEPETRTCNAQGCLNRKEIRIAGVLHGVTTSNFWKPIYAAAHQVAEDLGISLEMGPEEPTQNPEMMWQQMGSKINATCNSGVDGLIVTIPDRALFPSIRYCQSLEVPILSINSGAEFSKELGLMVHIGQMEYNAGFGAGERLISQGMKEGYCLIHNIENVALLDRCRGFEDAIAKHSDVLYHGLVEVSGDDADRSVFAVETAFERNGHTTFEDVAMLSCSQSLITAVMKINAKYPNVMAATFDYGEDLYGPLEDGRLKFAIDQQPLLQGMLPVYLLAYAADSKQQLVNPTVETGPHFVDSPPNEVQQICEGHHYNTCAAIPEEEMHKLPSSVVGIGSFFAALTILAALVCIAWTKYFWGKSELVHVSQPPFLFMLASGIIISTLSIPFMSVEADYPTVVSTLTGRLTDESSASIGRVNAACMAVPWLYSTGSVLIFASLFGKIWKIKLIYEAGARFRRVKVGLKDVLPYAMLLFLVVVTLLTAWQIYDPFVWTRNVELENSESLPMESYGECTSDTGWYFWIALLSFQLAYLIYALVLCWQTRAIPSSFAESSHVSLCVVCIFQISVLAIPVIAMVRDDTVAYYFIRACLVFLQNFTVLALIFGPKMWRVYKGDDKLVIRKSTMAASTNRHFSPGQPDMSGHPSTPFGYIRPDLKSENAELKLHILDLEAVGKGSLPPSQQEGSKANIMTIIEGKNEDAVTNNHDSGSNDVSNPSTVELTEDRAEEPTVVTVSKPQVE